MVRSGVPGERLFKENWEGVLHVGLTMDLVYSGWRMNENKLA